MSYFARQMVRICDPILQRFRKIMRIAGNEVVMFSNPTQLVNTIFGIYAVESLTPDRSESRGRKSLHIVAGIGRSPCVEPCYHIHINDNDYRFFGMVRDE